MPSWRSSPPSTEGSPEVIEAVQLTDVDDSWWDSDNDRGERLMVVGRTYAGRTLYVVLYPVDEDDGTWTLGTAIRREA